ncbi:hypothetical protein [Ralstonia pseudosolanacearum]|nr:hypothetical protein [Ralstonia pseudosolanacearum]
MKKTDLEKLKGLKLNNERKRQEQRTGKGASRAPARPSRAASC